MTQSIRNERKRILDHVFLCKLDAAVRHISFGILFIFYMSRPNVRAKKAILCGNCRMCINKSYFIKF